LKNIRVFVSAKLNFIQNKHIIRYAYELFCFKYNLKNMKTSLRAFWIDGC